MSAFAIKLKAAMEGANMKAIDLHNATGISKATISEYLAGSYEPKQRNILKLARALHVQPNELMGMESDSTPAAPSNCSTPTPAPLPSNAFAVPGGHRIPILGHIVAGTPIETIEDIIGYVEIDSRTAKCGKYFALEVKGSSMEPTLHDGDIIIVRQQEDIESGEMAVVLVNGNEATVKEVKESRDGLTLIGHNVAVYTPHFYSWEDVERLPVSVLGKVVEARRRF